MGLRRSTYSTGSTRFIDPALVGFLDAQGQALTGVPLRFFGDQLWPAPKGAEAFLS